jgi:alpha-N-arabinofuranosidase
MVIVLCGMLAAGMGASGEAAPAKELVPNASFETARGQRPEGWRPQTWGGAAQFQYADIGQTGKRSVMISSEKGADAAWTISVPVKPQSSYLLSGWIKTETVTPSNGRGALFNIHDMQGVQTRAITGTTDWTRLSVAFDTEDNDSIQINCLLGGWGLATGRAWYDDVSLELVSSREIKPSLAIDASKTSAPISPYIYGQFIEHLGRCIYGGIWAEMLEDRKFWYDVGAKGSPWTAIGDAANVAMAKENAYVGEHSPVITVAGGTASGIAHGGLGLIADREYRGRVILAGRDFKGAIEVSLVWGPGETDRETNTIAQPDNQDRKSPLAFKARATTDAGRLEIVGRGTGAFRIGAVSLMPADAIQGMRRDTLAALRELDSPVYRWPGGNFVSGYNWRDGLGDPDKRPPRKNPAWQGVEHNDFGLDEFMVFCRELHTEPYIAVNSGLGDVKAAAEEVEYANGSPESAMGKLRAQNGHAQPYGVKFWSIGNEMYGDWQLGHMPLEKYVQKHNDFAKGMRAVDPKIELIAVGAVGPWSETMLRNCADTMEYMSEHFYIQERPGVLAHSRQVPDNIRRIAAAHRRYRREIDALKGKDIRVALDEWNYWYGPHVFGELGTRYFLKDGLGIAAGLNEYARNSDIYFMANYAQTVNVIGAIKTNKTAAALETTGLALAMYRRHFGTIPVACVGRPYPLDVAAAWTDDRKALTIAVVNATEEPVSMPFTLTGANLSGKGRLWLMTGTDPMLYNDPGQPPKVRIEEREVNDFRNQLSVPALSASVYRLETK